MGKLIDTLYSHLNKPLLWILMALAFGAGIVNWFMTSSPPLSLSQRLSHPIEQIPTVQTGHYSQTLKPETKEKEDTTIRSIRQIPLFITFQSDDETP